MLIHLIEANINCGYLPPRINSSSIVQIPIAYISACLEAWVWSFFDENYHPLIPSFALATCQFIDRHLSGYRANRIANDHIKWEIDPWLEGDSDTVFYGRRIEFLNNLTFKRNFTERTGPLYILCKLPENAALKISGISSGEINIVGPADFDIIVTRCYLSQSHSYFYSFPCDVQVSNETKFNILSDAKFPGSILRIPNGEIKERFNIEVDIPIHWATGIKLFSIAGIEESVVTLPQWLAG